MTPASMSSSRAADRARLSLSAYWDAAYRAIEAAGRQSQRPVDPADRNPRPAEKEAAISR